MMGVGSPDGTFATGKRNNFKCSKEKWGFLYKEQGGGQWMENYPQETQGQRGILDKPT